VKGELTVPSEAFVKYHFREEDVAGGDGRLLPKLFEPGSGMKRFATPADMSLRAGFTRVRPEQGIKTYFWYKEIWFVISGSAALDVLDKRTGKSLSTRVEARDALYFPEGVRIDLRNDTSDDLYFLYCAVPASKRDAPWLAVMEAEDIEDVRIREEFRS
jgi:mannose-6-phosphate isomerase-like protein (cupin superfamily)